MQSAKGFRRCPAQDRCGVEDQRIEYQVAEGKLGVFLERAEGLGRVEGDRRSGEMQYGYRGISGAGRHAQHDRRQSKQAQRHRQALAGLFGVQGLGRPEPDRDVPLSAINRPLG